jgi:biotin operon repressor
VGRIKWRILALLLLADGAYLSACRLRSRASEFGAISQATLKTHLWVIRSHGVRIEMDPAAGYRMSTLPPDWMLEPILALVTEIRSQEPTPRAAPGSVTTPFAPRFPLAATRFSAAGAIASGR